MRSVVAWGLIIGFAVIYNFFTDSRRDNSGEVVAEGRESVFDLRIGDCITETTDAEQVSSTNVVPCADPHDYEVFANFDLDAATYPGRDAVLELAMEGCRARFDGYFQIAYQESELDVSAFFPTEDSWTRGADRGVSCLAYRMDDQPMLGKVRGL